MREYDVIRTLAQGFTRSGDQANGLFTCDAELVSIGGQTWAMTMDEFTPEEDVFLGDDPVRLGRNLAVGTLADLYAAGARPQFYMHSIALPPVGAELFGNGLVEGVRQVLEEAGCFLCGGDLATAETWRYCGFGLGPVGHRAVTRVLPVEPQAIWVTGTLGDANIAAVRRAETPLFELRAAEAAFIRDNATGCIDTSGGFMDGVWLLSELNPGLRFFIDLAAIPYAPEVLAVASAMGIPPEAALIGGAGEYELLFALPSTVDSLAIDAVKIGEAVPGDAGLVFLRDGQEVPVSSPPPCPRSFVDREQYIRKVLEAAGALHG